MITHRICRRFSVAAAALAMGMAAGVSAARAEPTRLDVTYDVRILGVFNLGTASLTTTLQPGGSYDSRMNARIWGGTAAVTSQGNLTAGALQPSGFALNLQNDKKEQQLVQIGMTRGNIDRVVLNPEQNRRSDRIPVTAAHKRGVVDPLSALIMPVSAKDNPLARENCNRTLPLFDGKERFDVTLRYGRTEQVNRGGYNGEMLVCRAAYKAISGHRPNRRQVQFMEENESIEVWLAPVGDTGAMVPWRIGVGTMIGTLVIEAQRFDVVRGRTAAVETR